MTEVERIERNTIATINPDYLSDASMNGTLISIDGASTDLRYLVGIRERGAGSRGRIPPNHRVDISDDNPWHGVTQFNLNSQYTHSQIMGYALANRAGVNTESAHIVQLRINAANPAGAGSPQYGSYIALEAVNSDMVKAHFPLDSGGNIYRSSSGNHAAGLGYLGNNFSSYVSAGYSKQNNSSDNDWTDLIHLCDQLNNVGNTTTYAVPDAAYVNAVRAVANVEEWMLYFALFTLTESEETSLATGAGDDFSLYRGALDPRFVLIAHDWDTILGEGDTAGVFNTNLFRMVPAVNGRGTNNNSDTTVLNRFMLNPEFAPIYYAQLKHLLDTTFSNYEESRTLDEELGSWVPGNVITRMKTFATNRNAYVASQIPLMLSVTSPLPVVSGFPQTASATATIFGSSDAINTRTILVNGVTSSWTAWTARWTNNNVSLQPGINRILIQALGTNGLEIGRTNIDIWYNLGGVGVAGTLASDTTWTAAGGPYNVTGTFTVPAGITLTIQPGTTVFFNSGVTMTVNGRVLAQGNENFSGSTNGHIRLTRVPGGGNWGSLDFLNTTVESRLEYVDIDGCAGTTIGGHAAEFHVNGGSIVFFDHLNFANVPAQEYISFDGSTFIVQNSIFPTYPWATSAPEMLHGINGIPANGYGIFRGDYFGHTFGFNDTIDFTGGQRPNAILQVINCVFDGAGDDNLDLDSTDAWIEGNVFMHVHRDPNRTDRGDDTGSAVSGGVDFDGQFSEWTIINNLFYDVDHVALNKGGVGSGAGRFIVINNTIAHVNQESGAGPSTNIAAFIFTDDAVPYPQASYGAGAYIANNIIWDCPKLADNFNTNVHTIIFENNIL